MKTPRIISCFARLLVALLLSIVGPRVFGIGGFGDTVIVAGDLTDNIKWPRELAQWQQEIENTSEAIQKADEMIQIVGDPQNAVKAFINSVPDLMAPVEQAIGLKTREEALRTANDLFFLKSVAVQTYKDANKVSDRFEAFGKTVNRDRTRYAHYILQEAMNARYEEAVRNADAVAKEEMARQAEAMSALQSETDQARIEVFKGMIAASKERLDLAQEKAKQAKAELDAFRGQLGVEDQRKAEADREWAQTIVEQMRQKALDAYKAQFADSNAGA